MKQTIRFLAAALLIGVTAPVTAQRLPEQSESRSSATQKYTCLMHPEVISEKPGSCPKCGMKLVPLKSTSPTHANRSGSAHAMHHDNPVTGNLAQTQSSMRSSVAVADPMSREGSGTSWLPDSTPVYARMFMFGDGMLMLHGAAFGRYTNVSTPRGDDRIDAPNWIMGMYSHPLGNTAQIGARLMMSLDLLTEGGRGYPLLFQSGESWHDQPLHDRQHPHDLFSELSVSYSQTLPSGFSVFFYFGYPGEPALGPPTFMHRTSAMDDPDAPLGHHWQDSTHVTFGVATAGLVWRSFKIEGSVFTGREPDETRYDFDRPRFDSLSGRISWNPTSNLALQFSHGYIKSPEALDPGLNRHRTTASLIYNIPLGTDANWATSFVWGQNNDTGEGKTQSFLLESDYQKARDTFYTRLERVEKSGHELVLSGSDLEKVFPLYSAAFGYIRDVVHGNGIDIGLGGQFTITHRPGDLNRYYGNGIGYGFEVFLRVRPSLHSMGAPNETMPMN